MITTLRRPRRLAALAVCAAALAAPAVASAVDTTIRVEGITDTIIPEGGVQIEGTGSSTVYDSVGTPAPVGHGSAFWQLLRASSGDGVGLRFTYYADWSSFFINQIGPDEPGSSDWWQYRVNHADPGVGADQATLTDGDSVIWFTGNGTGTNTLEIAPSTDKVAKGQSFTVKVTAYTSAGAPSPAAGAAVAFGSSQATTDAQGEATFIAPGDGARGVRATRAGDVRSATRTVCTYDVDPTVCNAPPAPPAPSPAPTPPASSELADTVAPGSSITAPALGSRQVRVRSLSGTAGPDRSDIAAVQASLGLRVGTQCRFRTVSGALTAARPCTQPEWLPARIAGGRWILPLGGSGLAQGTWRVESRATDGAGNVETVRVPGANIGSIRVTGRVVRPVTRLVSPRPGASVARLTSFSGTAGPAAADVSLVEVSAALRSGSRCRFLTRTGTLTGLRSCSSPLFVTARSDGSRWTRSAPSALPAGRWTVWSRARSASGVRGATAVANVTVGSAAR